MADQIGNAIDADIEGERQFAAYGSRNRCRYQPKDRRIDTVAFQIQKDKGQAQHQAYQVFADDFKRSQSGPFDIAVRKNRPIEDGNKNGRRNSEPAEKHPVGAQCLSDEHGVQQQGTAFQITGRYPELRRQIGPPVRAEHPHALVGQGMQKIDGADEKIRDPHKHQRIVFHHFPRVPDQKKNGPGHRYGKQFGEGMEKQIVVATDNHKSRQAENPERCPEFPAMGVLLVDVRADGCHRVLRMVIKKSRLSFLCEYDYPNIISNGGSTPRPSIRQF